ncbi:MAG: stage II sporulation protein R [Clostridia bacterium]|nr:stage II sporulation protein R [Clostridia bacterium]
MKKFLTIAAAVMVIIVATVIALGAQSGGRMENNDYLRIHVRANSNSQTDQSVKYLVKDEVVKFITPYVAECVDKPTAMKVVESILPQLEKVCDKKLKECGFDYTSKASVREEKFPTRVYGELTLEEGVYDALIIELGSGTGDNWWCVIYPPLCFTSASSNVEYRSAIFDIINKWRSK